MPDVAAAAAELARVLDEAEALVPEPDQAAAVAGPAEPVSRPPWNAAAADAVLAVHEGIRRLERALLAEITDDAERERRGGSDANTLQAISSVVRLSAGVSADHADAVAFVLDRWAAAAKRLRAVDELARWTQLRAEAGKLPPACEMCKLYSLRVAETSGVVACFTPGCTDLKGNPPAGRLDVHKLTHQPVLAWNDGRVQYPP